MAQTKKKTKTSKNKTAKKKNEYKIAKRIKWKGDDEKDAWRNKSDTSWLRIKQHRKTGKVVIDGKMKGWPEDKLLFFNTLDDKQKYNRGGIEKSLWETWKNPQNKTVTKQKTITKKTPTRTQYVVKKDIEKPKSVPLPTPVIKEKIKTKPKTATKGKVDVEEIILDSLDSPIKYSPVDFNESCQLLIDTIKDSLHTMSITDKQYQKVLACIEEKNKKELKKHVKDDVVYPHLDDPNFTLKLSRKKEFNEVKIEKKTRKQIDNIKEEANKLCDPNIEFELDPHQMFVRNFLSFQTPYNSLLIFHGLGTGKTCSSITVCEEVRTYNQQIGNTKKIMIIASPVVQENYKLQLFDERKLRKINGLWNIKACTGNKFIKDVNPMNMKGLTKEKIVKQIKKIIRHSYEFIGYTEFANKINNILKLNKFGDKQRQERRKIYAIKKEFSDRLLVIDEVHNIRAKDISKRTTKNMLDLVTYADNIKLLLLTATPMFNDAKEIIWLVNLMNLNDKRFTIKIKDVFDKTGDFIKKRDGEIMGKELLIQKITGYVSYVSGENPFTFPYRIWPYEANNPHSLKDLLQNGEWKYPSKQINGLTITSKMEIKYIDLVITKLSDEQQHAYNYIIKRSKEKYPILNEKRNGIQYTVIDGPLQALNIVYPHEDLKSKNPSSNIEQYLYGKNGLTRTMHYSHDDKKNFEYTEDTLAKFGKIFSADGNESSPLKKYSCKIYSIIKKIQSNEGIVLIYSNYIDGGCVPIALALEEMGITRYGPKNKSLFKSPPTKPYKIKKRSAKYIMITGDKQLSPNNKLELKAVTDPKNINGDIVKVIIISKAGSEGLDFQNIRQVHVLEPWFNLNRIDQIIGRAVRNKSHCKLPYNKRNVEIYMYGSELDNDVEPIDLYVYRIAEYKSIRIGKITRLLKENAIDCLINKNQQDMIASNMNKNVTQTLSTGDVIDFRIGYKNNSIICDFMNCEYSCNPNNRIIGKISETTYTKNFIIMNLEKILQRIRNLFKAHYIFEKSELQNEINAIKHYSSEQINTALNTLINDKKEYLTDMFGRTGRLVNIGKYYLFQPLELDNKHITHLERKRPLDVKQDKLTLLVSSIDPKFSQKAAKDIVKDTNTILKLQEDFLLLTTPLYVTKKKNWIQTAAWAIKNLVRWNNLEKEELLYYGLEHLFDILSIDNKIDILNDLNSKIQLDLTFKNKLLRVINKFKLDINGQIYYACADYNKKYTTHGRNYTLLKLDDSKTPQIWSALPNLIRSEASALVKRFRINKEDCNDFIGFLTKSSNSKNVLFKTKKTNLRKEERTNKGQRCPSGGEKRRDVYRRLNGIAKILNKKQKYAMVKQKTANRSSVDIIQSIYGNTHYKQYVDEDLDKKDLQKKKNIVSFTDTQLCAETELLLRHLDEIKKNNKRWFFGTLEDCINKIAEIRK